MWCRKGENGQVIQHSLCLTNSTKPSMLLLCRPSSLPGESASAGGTDIVKLCLRMLFVALHRCGWMVVLMSLNVTLDGFIDELKWQFHRWTEVMVSLEFNDSCCLCCSQSLMTAAVFVAVKVLLDKGANPNSRDMLGNTPMHLGEAFSWYHQQWVPCPVLSHASLLTSFQSHCPVILPWNGECTMMRLVPAF